MEISDPKVGSITEPSEGSSAQGGIADRSSMKTDVESSIKFDLSDLPRKLDTTCGKYYLHYVWFFRYIFGTPSRIFAKVFETNASHNKFIIYIYGITFTKICNVIGNDVMCLR